MVYDCILIGGGPAALAAAIYLARQKSSFIMLAGTVGGKTIWSADIENYLGFHLLSGIDLVKKFREHVADYADNFSLKEGEYVEQIRQEITGFRVQTSSKSVYAGRTVLVATGQENRMLNVPGEKELYGHGVTYCATCDAPLYRDREVHVVGGGNSAMDAALLLEKYVRHVTIICLNADLAGDAVMKQRCLQSKNITIKLGTRTTRIEGEASVTGIGLLGADGVEYTEPSQGVFIEIGQMPNTACVSGIDLEKDRAGQIIVDAHNRTSVRGVWAAGDVTNISEKQIAVAVGEGSKAALDIIKYLQSMHV